MNGQGSTDGETEDSAICGGFNNWTKCLVVINTELLRKTTDHPALFLARKRPIRVKLVAEDSLASVYISTRWGRNKSPCSVIKESMIFLLHGSTRSVDP